MQRKSLPKSKISNPISNESQNERQMWQLLSLAKNGHFKFK